MFTDLDLETPNWGCGTLWKRWKLGVENSVQTLWCDSTESNSCSCKAGARERGKEAFKVTAPAAVVNQQTIAKLEEQLKAAKNENKRLAAKAQRMDSVKELDVVLDAANAEIDAVDLDELQTLVDLSNKYFLESMHNAALREKLAAERKKKQDAKPVQAQISNLSRRLEKKRKAKAAADQKITDLRKQLECEEASVAVLAVDIDELGRELQVLQRRAMLTGAETAMCGERVFNLMRESLPKQLDQRPEIAAILDNVRSGMARLFHMANEMLHKRPHTTSAPKPSLTIKRWKMSTMMAMVMVLISWILVTCSPRWLMCITSTETKLLSVWVPFSRGNRNVCVYMESRSAKTQRHVRSAVLSQCRPFGLTAEEAARAVAVIPELFCANFSFQVSAAGALAVECEAAIPSARFVITWACWWCIQRSVLNRVCVGYRWHCRLILHMPSPVSMGTCVMLSTVRRRLRLLSRS